MSSSLKRGIVFVKQRFQITQSRINFFVPVIAASFIQVLTTNRAKPFAVRPADRLDGHCQEHFFSNQRRQIQFSILWYKQA